MSLSTSTKVLRPMPGREANSAQSWDDGIVQWRIQDGAFGASPPLHLVEEWPAILVIKILNFMSGQDQFSYTTHENMYILLAFIKISPEAEANQC